MKQEDLMKMMAEANSCDEICPVIEKIAELANGSFELLAETVFERDEDELIFSMMLKFFAEERYMEAVDILALSFSLAGADEAFMFMALIGSTGRDDIYSAFMHSFFKHSERCEIATIELINPDELN